MQDQNFDVFRSRELSRKEIVIAIDRAFQHRELNIVAAKEELQVAQFVEISNINKQREVIMNSPSPESEKTMAVADLIMHLGKFKPKASMAITYISHDYPFLVEHAWEKIQKESGRPIEALSPDLQKYIQGQITEMVKEELQHAVPIEGLNEVDKYYGVIFFEENGEYGITPFMGFGGDVSVITYRDIFTIPDKTSDFDHGISNKLM